MHITTITTTTALRLAAVTAIAALTPLAALANGEGDNAPERATPFMSTVSVAQVRAEARMPVVITNGTGTIELAASTRSREDVRQEALQAARTGSAPHGEIGPM